MQGTRRTPRTFNASDLSVAVSDTPRSSTNQHALPPDHASPLEVGGASELFVSPKRLLTILLVIVIFLVVAGVIVNSASFTSYVTGHERELGLFNLDFEANVPTWFSSLLLFINAFLIAIIASLETKERGRWRIYWVLLALIFLFLSLDETIQLHEGAILPLREGFNLSGPLYYAWVLPAMACLVIFGAIYLRFCWSLPRRTLGLFLLAALLYVGGALGFEMLGGTYISHYVEKSVVYGLITVVEESLELLGQVVFFYALADYIRTRWSTISFHFGA